MRTCVAVGILFSLMWIHTASAAEDLLLQTRVDPVDVEIFVPKEAQPVQGLLVHVFNYKLKTTDSSATLCRQLKWAHINTVISRKETNRPLKIRKAIETALVEFAKKADRPELVHVPRTGIGFSAGGMVINVLEHEPERMLTNAISCSWVRNSAEMGDKAAIPELFIIGAVPDGFKMLPAIEQYFEPALQAKRPWGLGLQHECAHDWANSGTLANQWIRSIVRLRYPETVDASKPIPLWAVRFEDGWVGDRSSINGTWATVMPAKEFRGDLKTATWLPDRATAFVWRAWQTQKSPVDLTARAATGAFQLPAFSPKKGLSLTVPTGTDLILGVKAKTDRPLTSVQYYHGDTLIGEAKSAPWEVTWKAPALGCYAVWAVYGSEQPAATNPALICVDPVAVAEKK